MAGEAKSLSRDAIADDMLGLHYAARVRVAKSTMYVDGVDVAPSPGMAVSAEVMAGTRRLIEFLLSAVMEHVKESGRERWRLVGGPNCAWINIVCDKDDTSEG